MQARLPHLGQQFDFPATAAEAEAVLSKALPGLAPAQVIPAYKESDRDRYLDNLFRLQMTAGRYAEAEGTLRSLHDLRRAANLARAAENLGPYRIYANAKVRQATAKVLFDEAFRRSFREFFGPLDDIASARALWWFFGSLDEAHNSLLATMARQKGKKEIALADALDLVSAYQFYQLMKGIEPLRDPLTAEEDSRRYIINKDVLIKTQDGAHIAAMLYGRGQPRKPSLRCSLTPSTPIITWTMPG